MQPVLPIFRGLFVCAALGTLLAGPVSAGTQQDKMTACNKEAGAKNLSGDARKAFMSDCLKAKPAAPMTQQDKMTYCNKEAGAKNLSGDARKTFMSDCLKAKASSAPKDQAHPVS
jgi:hypothetical protein